MKIIGRKEEMRELERLTNSGMPEFVAVYGRRRVGKTFLVKEFFGNNFVFYTTGVSRGSKVEQLRNFQESLSEYGYRGDSEAPRDWFEAFARLKEVVSRGACGFSRGSRHGHRKASPVPALGIPPVLALLRT